MKLSLNKTEYNNKYYAQNNDNNLSFKGHPQNIMKAISGMMDRSRFLTSYSKKFDANSTMNAVRKRIGTAGDVLLEHIKNDEIIKTGLIEDGGKIRFRNKKPIRLILDGVIYPVAKIPFYILYGGLNQLKKLNIVKNSNWLKNFEKSSFYQVTHSYMKKDDKLHALQGLMEIGANSNVLGGKMRAKQFLHNTAKTFDSKFGNYNGVHERALTRIVTGFIPAFFLANDAHNLSILCNNNKKDAQNEKHLRFQQESRRVLSNAYIQLITLGALSKFINKSKGWFVGVTVGTVLLTEIYSRLKTGKKIHFISAQEAKEINAQERMKKVQESMDKGLSFVLDEAPTPLNVNMNGVKTFIKEPDKNKFRDILQPKPKEDKTSGKDKTKALMSLGTFAKVVAGIIVTGFAIKGLKKVPLKKGYKVGDLFNSVAKGYQKLYNKVTTKQNHIQKTDMTKIFEKMKNCGFGTIAESYRKVVNDYQRIIELPKHIGADFIEALNKSGETELAKHIQALATGKDQKQLLSALKKESINRNFNVLMTYLKKAKQNDLIDRITDVTNEKGIDYGRLRKVFNKPEAEKYREVFENIFAVDDNTLKHGLLMKAKSVLFNKGQSKIWQKTEEEAIKVFNGRDYYDLGKTKVPFVKDLVDFCIEPFKFFWNFVTSPYKVLYKIANMTKATPRKGLNDIDAVAKALNSLTKKTSMNDEVFTNMFNEKIVKGFNNTSMSKIANSDLSSLAKTASTIATMSFLISDNYNMVMLKSNGENEQEAKQKGKERFIQEMSRFLWQQMFINMFNNSFAHTYNASLLGASVVNAASTYATETCTRKAVGIPTKAVSKEAILNLEKENLSGDGLKSKIFRFMSKLTGKQVISEREKKTK